VVEVKNMVLWFEIMDDLIDNPLGNPASGMASPLNSPLAVPAPAAPGRAAAVKEPSRQQSDQKYKLAQEFMEAMPEEAMQPRIAVFRALPGSDTKADHRPERRISFTDWQEFELKDQGALKSYLEENLGPGYYMIEPQDHQNKKLDKVASWTLLVGYKDINDMRDDDDFIDDEDDQDSRRGGRGGRSRKRDRYSRRGHEREDDLDYLNDLEDDPRMRRANTMDYLTMSNTEERREVEAMKGQTDNLMTALMLSQREDQTARREEARLREERVERERLDQRRADEDKEERRREQEKRDWDARMEAQRREDDKRAEEYRRQSEASQKRTEMMLGMFTAGIPLLKGVMEKKEDPMMALMISNAMKDKGADPVMMMLLKNMMDKQSQSSGSDELIKQMGAMSTMSSKMMADQMGTMMQTSNKMTTDMIQQMYKNAMANPNSTEDEKSNWAQIIEALGSASGLVGNLLNAPPGAPPGMVPQQQMMHPAQQQAMLQHQQQQMQEAQAQKTWGEMTPEEQQAYIDGRGVVNGATPPPLVQPQPQPQQQQQQQQAQPQLPSGVPAVVESLMSIHVMGPQLSAEEQNGMVEFMITQMPIELRSAVKAGDQEKLMEICGPVFMQSAPLFEWVQQEGVEEWLETFVPTLAVNIDRLEEQNVIEATDAEVVGSETAAEIEAEAVAVAADEDSPI
jgi:hypothetical protein